MATAPCTDRALRAPRLPVIPIAALQSLRSPTDKPTMAKATRFDLSRLEGCTGTVSDDRVAVPHAIRPAPPAAPASGTASASPPPVARRGTPEDLVIVPEAPTEESAPSSRSEGPEAEYPAAAPAPTAPAAVASTADAPAAPAKRGARTSTPGPERTPIRSIEEAAGAVLAVPERDANEGVRLGVILALTLSAWIPVLLIWWATLG